MKQESKTITVSIIAGLVAAVTLGMFSAPALAQPSQGRGAFNLDPRAEERTYHFADTGKDLPYCIFASSKIDACKPAPLIISLHGYGAGPQIMCNSTAVDLAEEGSYILAAPMGYSTSGWYGIPSADRRGGGRGGTSDQPANLAELSEKDVMNVLKMMRKEFNVDEKRIYLSGHSMGAAGTMYLGSKHADIWAAIAPIDGGAKYGRPEILKPLKNARVAVLIVQGDKDELVSVEDAKALAAAMKDMGIEHEYVEMPGISHGPSMTAGQKHVFEFFGKHSK
jgi:predicted peptidase